MAVLNDKQVLVSASANILSLKGKNASLAFMIFNTDDVFPAFKTFFIISFLKTAQFYSQ